MERLYLSSKTASDDDNQYYNGVCISLLYNNYIYIHKNRKPIIAIYESKVVQYIQQNESTRKNCIHFQN